MPTRALASLILVSAACAAPPSAPLSPTAPSPPPDEAGAGAAPTEAECAHAFDPPPGATPLCDEHVLGTGMEIAWRSFATKGAPTETFAPYMRLARCPGVEKRPGLSLGKGDLHVTVHAPSERFPTCDTPPPPGASAVVVVSTAYRR